jgi:thiosulfate reductase cytochrome b subunit
MAASDWDRSRAASPESARSPRHAAFVRITHWVAALSFCALLLSGVEILISHPRFYWGEAGNVATPALFQIPIPSSRAIIPTGYGFVLPDQNGWSRALHFQSAWAVVIAGLFYVGIGLWTRHFRRNLLPSRQDLAWGALSATLADHLRFKRPGEEEAWSYNTLQRITYLKVIFVLFPIMIWTGLAMSPGFVSAFPATVTVLGGQQSARTIHFFATLALVLFTVVHILMVSLAGFGPRVAAMITGKAGGAKEEA